MIKTNIILLLVHALLALPANAAEQTVFYGIWGTKNQCAGNPIKPGGTVLDTPFEISKDWLRQGGQWCRLNWGPVEKRKQGYFSVANALCGEDNAQSYFLGFVLAKNDLTIRWAFPHKSGPLNKCMPN